MTKFGIGQPVKRFEDPRLLSGKGRFINDVNLAGQAYAVMLRSPHANARIIALDTSSARAAPGVLAVYTGADIAAAGLGTMTPAVQRKRPDGTPMFARSHPGLVSGWVRYVGDPFALVIAESLMQAKDAAELVAVEYHDLPSITDTAQAAAGKEAVWPECPDNISNVFEAGDAVTTEAAFARAAHIVRRRYVISRVYAHFMEPRGVIGDYDPGEDRYTLYADVQYPHRVRNALANKIFKIPENKIRVIAGDVGGGFGTKGWQYPEHRLMLWAAKMLGRPVKWTCERQEAILADEHARDNISEAELALDADNRILALRVRTLANVGAYVSSDRNLLATFTNVSTLVGVYDIAAAHVHVSCVMSNSNGTAPYRGAGRPEAMYVIERLLDDAARELNLDPIDLRRKNIITADAMPYKSAFGRTYDCGEFDVNMERVLQLADRGGFDARRQDSGTRGKLRGFGFANAIEKAASPGLEFAEIRFNPSGSAMILMGSKNQGQGHETIFRQIVAERFGIDPSEIQYIDGDTDRVAFGIGTNGSRSTVIGGTALWQAADKIIAKGKKVAAHFLEADAQDIEFSNGLFTVAGTDRGMSLTEAAKSAFMHAKLPPGLEGGLFETSTFSPTAETYPNGAHACEVEIDPDTGQVDLLSYAVVDDVGTVINPVGLKGQIHGGIAQGVGQALMEEVVYDRDSGQLLSGSFMDYTMPRADTTCAIQVESNPVPTKLNPLGAKGAGEAGTVGALPAVMNAVLDALATVGVTELDMPATSERVWQAIQGAKSE
ncbi:MAG: xanthine dehydrogenase family protein molybdopterin-binding subunit [Rhodospirillaceae bacterium]|jgi:aerobic carbon-monoxide dehydrogenase large subunit|nr:xanthine dehydrogenase family protein molybdopterin-binding subunit [Rhodospirillaceae bacterium]MBT4691125.1 xanthine dehydrogenase family protein molybdopterin-binding subunit [Rhodospirillaceae bacterium]MBT5080644.1 xanthine dehydrogenase family protein molybdopterin-binding subunit [Rhodospirillaceae bacterium]MBT5525072.1 xanthine dehydrogenase family protein molybdopterin-binding subunit [Rhodospirillaceae bacterium]MBT5878042.1 xanthine dehydrogenase family protein molybdopterin-bind